MLSIYVQLSICVIMLLKQLIMLVCDQVLSFASDEIIKKDVALVSEVSQTQECPNTIKFYCGISPSLC